MDQKDYERERLADLALYYERERDKEERARREIQQQRAAKAIYYADHHAYNWEQALQTNIRRLKKQAAEFPEDEASDPFFTKSAMGFELAKTILAEENEKVAKAIERLRAEIQLLERSAQTRTVERLQEAEVLPNVIGDLDEAFKRNNPDYLLDW